MTRRRADRPLPTKPHVAHLRASRHERPGRQPRCSLRNDASAPSRFLRLLTALASGAPRPRRTSCCTSFRRIVAPPTITWRCPRCRCSKFICSERFRMNTNAKSPTSGSSTAARSATAQEPHDRRANAVAKISPSLVDAALTNDSVAARRFARDLHLLRSAGVQVLEATISLSGGARRGMRAAALRRAAACTPRPRDQRAFGLSRSQLRAIDTSGGLRLDPPAPLSRLRLAMTTTSLRSRTCSEFDQ